MKPSTVFLIFLGMLWILAITVGSYAIVNYQFSPGTGATPQARWPLASKIQLDKNRATLIMLAHPQCPCTHASVAELSRLMSRNQDKVKAYVLFFAPQTLPRDWEERTVLRKETERIPGVTVLDDVDANEAKVFQAVTSGQTFVYNARGDLLFNGGITAARGQLGDSTAARSLESTLQTQPSAKVQTALVFGCPLITPVRK